jgi:hypothetical protein
MLGFVVWTATCTISGKSALGFGMVYSCAAESVGFDFGYAGVLLLFAAGAAYGALSIYEEFHCPGSRS